MPETLAEVSFAVFRWKLAITASPEQCRHLPVDSAAARWFLAKLDQEGEVYDPKAVLYVAQ